MQDQRSQRTLILLAAALIVLLGVIYAVSGVMSGTFEDTTYLTPVPQSTIDAFSDKQILITKLQAVVAARRALDMSRIRFDQPPNVRSVVKTTMAEAQKRVNGSSALLSEPRPGSTLVWLVWFEGNLRIEVLSIAGSTPVPQPFGLGCAFVIIPADQKPGMSVDGTHCP